MRSRSLISPQNNHTSKTNATMYSVEDLLISHGYKLPQNAAPAAASPSPPSYEKCYSDCRHEILENRSSHGTVNGYETDSGPYVCSSRQPLAKGYSSDNECRDRNQQRREADTGNQGDTHSLGDSLTTDSGFYDGPRGVCSQPRGPRDVSYWRRRGQDFSVLLDYADFREPRGGGGGGGGGGYGRTGGVQQRGQNASAEEHQRERQRWVAQAQAQAQAQARSRQREAALQQWRMAAERKCQSLGTDEWRPAVTFARQLSDSEGERWAQEQRHHARTPDGAVLPRTKGKSQSLPRMLQPDSLQYVDMSTSGQDLYRRVNGHPSQDPYRRHHSDGSGRERWPENDRPASQASIVPKPRFSRPLRPPSYEVHQQTRGSSEMLAGDSAPTARDNTPLPHPRAEDPRLDYFAQEPTGPGMEPPGYNPPPSYKRPPVIRGGHRGYSEAPVNYRYRGEMYQQVYRAPDRGHWFSRHPGGSWPEHQRERSVPSRKQVYPGYGPQEHSGGVQYIPFDDPRVRHISGGIGGNSLTDADKIRHIRNELPSVTVSEHSSDDSAFLPPPGPLASPDTNKRSSSDYDNDNRWLTDLHKETDNFPAATDQNCNRYPKNQGPSTFQATASRQSSSSDQGFSETITQVKKIVPDSGVENNKNTKRKISETIFCLVSVPIQMQANKDSADQNNNETMPSLSVSATETTVSHSESQNLRSKSLTDMPLKSHIHTNSSSSMRSSKKTPLRKEIVDAWSLQANADKELCYAGSWPGDQYRNQETQTSSPVAVKGPPQSPPGQEPGQPSSDTTMDSSVSTDCSASYGYPMKGRKNLNPSSKSAFSRLSISPAQPPPLLPSGPAEERDQPSSSKKSVAKPQDANKPVAFGQFLLKPASRRPWDAIEELECFNKELQDQITKQPSVDQCIEDLDEAYRNILELSNTGNQPETAQHVAPPIPERPSVENWGSAIDPDYREVRSAFTRPQGRTTTRPPRDDVSTLSELSLTDYGPLIPQGDTRVYRQDIPVAQESLLRDVGLTVYTEAPGIPGEPCAVLPTALDHQELCQNIQLSWESRISLAKGVPEHINEHSKETFDRPKVEEERKVNVDNMPSLRGEPNLNIRRARSESSRSPRFEGSPCVNRLTREVTFMFEDYDISPDPLSWRNGVTIADKHLETLLINEKANAIPAEDLSNLYEVKCAEGIPENESIEQRAARILGIAVPVGALGVAEKQEHQDATAESEDLIRETQNHSPDRETQHVRRQYEQVTEVSVVSHRQRKKTSEEKEPEPSKDNSQCEERNDGESHPMVLELPECPPSRLPLSLPVTPDEELALSVFGERKGRSASKLIEALQDKLASFPTSPGLTATERTARMKEVDSVSSTRSLSIKSSNSEGEAELEQEKYENLEEGGSQPEEKKEREVEEEEDVDVTDEGTTAKQNEGKETEEEEETVMDEEQKEPEVEGEREEEKEKREGQDVVTEPMEEDKSEEKMEPDVEERREEEEKVPEVEVKREEEEEKRKDSVEEKEDSSEQVSRPQKPPLLPKPRSGTVAKREITLPLSFNVSCGSSTLEDEELLSVSDSYDPSRVERV